MKACACCKESKPFDQFHNSKAHGGKYPYCKPCQRKKTKTSYAKPETKARVKRYMALPEVVERSRLRQIASPRHALSVSLNRALKRRPGEGAVTIDELMDLWVVQKGLCAISQLPMTWFSGKTLPTSISIDRIDNAKGYIKNNVRLVCYAVNALRGRWTDDEMYEIATAIVANRLV